MVPLSALAITNDCEGIEEILNEFKCGFILFKLFVISVPHRQVIDGVESMPFTFFVLPPILFWKVAASWWPTALLQH